MSTADLTAAATSARSRSSAGRSGVPSSPTLVAPRRRRSSRARLALPGLVRRSAAFNRDESVSGTRWLPAHFTLDNFGDLLHNQVNDASSGSYVDSPFLRWLAEHARRRVRHGDRHGHVSALAAYAFSRFRFKGRRMGMLALLLVQMFPQILLVVAIYLIVLNVGAVFRVVGLNTFTALIIVYLGGALGVNTWLLKGFFDTIPAELDESARVDGATAGQIFWGVVLPLALRSSSSWGCSRSSRR